MDGDGSGSVDWNSQPVGSPGRKINRAAVTTVCDWNREHSAAMLNTQAAATRQPRVSSTHPPVLVRLPTSGLAAVIPGVIHSRRNLPGIDWGMGGRQQPQKGKPFHAGTLREGCALPASDRVLRGAPLLARVLAAGALGGSDVREKSPVACGKSSAGISAPPLRR